LRKLCEGGVAHSFGIHVARLAGMPQAVVESAQRKLLRLESMRDADSRKENEDKKALSGRKKSTLQDNLQLSFYQLDDPLLVEIKEKLQAMDINTMSPLDAFDALRALKKQIGCK
jgi:DNA mismatch repair protein MutS